MNDRIKELMEQASSGACYDENTPTLYGTEIEKFAELIVQECIGIIHQQERVPKEFFFAKSALQHELAIKEHFGVNND